MAEITNVDGDETNVTQNKDALSSAQMTNEFDSPVMWDNSDDEGGDDEDESARSFARRLLDKLR